MVTITPIPRNGANASHETAVVDREAYEAVETSPQIPGTIKELIGKPEPGKKESLLHKAMGAVLASYDWLSGPPMTQRERIQRELAKGHDRIPTIFGGV